MNPAFVIRSATKADIATIARHRAEMFKDMGSLPSELYQSVVDESMRFLERTIPTGEYRGWLAVPTGEPATIVAGAGMQLRIAMPRALHYSGEHAFSQGREGIVINVYTERPWRRKGLAALLMDALLGWAKTAELDTLVLHASSEGRHLYEKLGFQQTNEMRFQDWLGGRPRAVEPPQ